MSNFNDLLKKRTERVQFFHSSICKKIFLKQYIWDVLFATKNQRFQKSWFLETLEFQGFCSTTQFHHIWSCTCNNRSRKTHQGCFPPIWVSISNFYFPLVRGLHYCTSLYKINRSGAVRIFSIRLCIISASKKKIRSFIKHLQKHLVKTRFHFSLVEGSCVHSEKLFEKCHIFATLVAYRWRGGLIVFHFKHQKSSYVALSPDYRWRALSGATEKSHQPYPTKVVFISH